MKYNVSLVYEFNGFELRIRRPELEDSPGCYTFERIPLTQDDLDRLTVELFAAQHEATLATTVTG